MQKPDRKFAMFKNVLAVLTGLFGIAIAISPSSSPRYIIALTGHYEIAQLLGALMLVFSIVGMYLDFSAIRTWAMVIPFSIYTGLTLLGASQVGDPVPSTFVLLILPVALTAAYVYERVNHGE
jgi:hypothetical protein